MIPPNNIYRMIIYLLEYKKGICIENRLERSVPVIKTDCVSGHYCRMSAFSSCVCGERVPVIKSRDPAA